MSSNGKVIDLSKRRSLRQKKAKGDKLNPTVTPAHDSPASIVNMTERRKEMLSEERRRVKRTILTEFIGAFVVVPERGLLKVALYDISENGLAFDLEPADGPFKLGESVAMRVYLNHQTYFPFTMTIQNIRAIEDEGVIRHGGALSRGALNDRALYHFTKFIEHVSASLETDRGDVMVSNLNK